MPRQPSAETRWHGLHGRDQACSRAYSRPQDSGGDHTRLRLETVERLNRQTFETAVRFVAGPSREYLQTLASA